VGSLNFYFLDNFQERHYSVHLQKQDEILLAQVQAIVHHSQQTSQQREVYLSLRDSSFYLGQF
jgi:hypothetical protein